MSSSFEKSVKGATKVKAAPPKTKYIEHILVATHSGEHGVAEVFRSLQSRIRDSTWTVVFKSLITVHLMIREGSQDVTLEFLSKHRNMLATSGFSDAQSQGRNIRHYSNYLTERARAYRDTKVDWVRGAERRLDKATVEKGLLRETEVVQQQIVALLKCDVLDTEPDNEITITVFRMLVLDLLSLFHIMNQGLINILGHFFEMSKPDAERSMEIYRKFAKQTDLVVQYLAVARQYQNQTRVEVPKLKHAPITLGKSLEDYLEDPDFEVNRRQYITELSAKKSGKISNTTAKSTLGPITAASKSAGDQSFPDVEPLQSQKSVPAAKGPQADLIDFFESIDTAPPPVAHQDMSGYNSMPQFQITQPQQYQQTGFQQGMSGPYQHQQQLPQQFENSFQPQQLQPQSTGFGFGGYSPQAYQTTSLSSIPQDAPASFQAQQTGFGNMNSANNTPQAQHLQTQVTNPFRLSMMAVQPSQQFPQSPPNSAPMQLQPQSTNPFARSANTSPPQSEQMQSFSPPPDNPSQFSSLQHPAAPQLVPMATGTNPFAKGYGQVGTTALPQQQLQHTGGLMPQQTGSTNPFRQSQFVNTATGQGWQNNQGTIGGGLDMLETVPVFPRPASQNPWG